MSILSQLDRIFDRVFGSAPRKGEEKPAPRVMSFSLRKYTLSGSRPARLRSHELAVNTVDVKLFYATEQGQVGEVNLQHLPREVTDILLTRIHVYKDQ